MVTVINRRSGLAAAWALCASLGLLASASAPAQTPQPQVAWTSAMSIAAPSTRSNYTCRWIARPSLSGDTVRVRLSNTYSGSPATLNAVTVAKRTTRAAVKGVVPLTFGGNSGVTIPAGGVVVSDPVPFKVALQQDLAVSIYVSGSNPVVVADPVNTVTSFCTNVDGTGGDHSSDSADSAFPHSGVEMHWLDAIDVYTAPRSGAVVALGDSITNGLYAEVDGHDRWIDILSNRLLSKPQPKSVANEGIGGDTACANSAHNGAVDRLDRDVLAQSGVSHVVLYIGTNDVAIGTTGSAVISCYQNIIARVHAAGLPIIGATMIPRSFDATRESYRAQINSWIRTPGNFDAVIDFDAAVRDPANPVNIAPRYDDGDRIHPNVPGHLAMGNAIDLGIFSLVPRVNLALGRPATADSACTAAQTADKAANGSFTGGGDDKWCSGGAAPWWQVDLGISYDVNQVVIYHAGVGGEARDFNSGAFKVQTSTDGTKWVTQAKVNNNIASVTATNLKPATARHVRISLTEPQQSAGGAARLYEVQVFGSTWKACADETARCDFTGSRIVRYGAGDTYLSRVVKAGIDCTNAAFGSDPVPGVAKHCEISPTWAACAVQDAHCDFTGPMVAQYGAAGKYAYKVASGGIDCSTAAFGSDPAPGTDKKCSFSPRPSADSGWTRCAVEGGECVFEGTRTVAYGANLSHAYRSVNGRVACTNAGIGEDPAFGFAKTCWVK